MHILHPSVICPGVGFINVYVPGQMEYLTSISRNNIMSLRQSYLMCSSVLLPAKRTQQSSILPSKKGTRLMLDVIIHSLKAEVELYFVIYK